MKKHLLLAFTLLVFLSFGHAQQSRNVVVFLMDGYRWKELYEGADSSLLFNKKYNHHDSAWTVTKYWDANLETRRQKLMPFVWETMSKNGQLLGNRNLGNFANVTNKYWFSYPGRSEAFTGYYDSAVNSNEYPDNPNTNVLEFIDKQPGFHGKVVTFSSWDAVARILNRNRNKMYVNVWGEDVKGDNLTPQQKEANLYSHLLPELFGKGERVDAGTYVMAKAYLQANHPRVLYIDLGDNDEFAHAADYADYLDAAHYDDAMFRDIWTTLQNDPFYKDNTTLLIFPDHGRGYGPGWTSHGAAVAHSNEIYFLAMGPGVPAKGEVKDSGQVYQAQYAATIAALLGLKYTAEHPVADPIKSVLK
ncbi:MAG: phosphoglyceromutase [Bacteroidetes bacterium]|nr:phosphoglyceromutase [Bacteroidota bacterium]